MSFAQDTHVEVRKLLLADNPKARESDGKINGINCPDCGKPEAYAYADKPNVVMCHRFNKCGTKTSTREIYPQLFTDFTKRFPVTEKNPVATAEAFMQSRSLDTSLFEFGQGAVVENGTTYPTVKISFDGVTFERLIDYKGNNKTRITKYKGKYYATKSVPDARETYVVEGISDALALEQVGIPAIATLSSGHNPEVCFIRGVDYILAFDNDKAGIKAVKVLRGFFNGKGINYKVQLPPKGKDWNDLLIDGDLSPAKKAGTLELCAWHGALAMASNAMDHFKVLSKKEKYNRVIFEFNLQTYKGSFTVDKDGNPDEHKVSRLLDCVLNIAFSIEDASLPNESRISHIVKAESSREGVNNIRLRGGDFSATSDFKTKLLQYRLLFYGNGHDLTLLAEYLFNKRPIKVRECQALGYEPASDCFVFTKFLYDKSGKHCLIDNDGYFHHHKLKPFSGQDKSINRIGQIDVGKFVADLHNAYGDKGLLALGFWVSTTFSHVVFDKFGFFPFMSLHGDPHCGKSDLTTTLNRCFYIDSEGLPMSSGNTKKGELRVMSQKSSMVTAMLEGRKDKVRFDYDSILPLYNRNSLQVRAQTTNDNQVHDLKFSGSLAFVQNIEQFVSKPAKERVVSIKFVQDGLDNTFEAWKHLKTYSPEQLAGVGHFILSNRSHFEKSINSVIEETADYLRDQGVGIDRVAKNHAVSFAGASLLMELAKSDIKDDLLGYTLKCSMSKIETARSELLIADHFMECIDGFGELQGVKLSEGCLIVDMPKAIKATGESWNKTELLGQLKMTDVFVEIKASRAFDKTKPSKCWHFKNES